MGNLENMAVALLAPLPSLLFFFFSLLRCSPDSWSLSLHPIVLANLLFFLNVDVLFWLLGLLSSNFWLIDLYWTVIPVLLVHFYAAHPKALADPTRSAVVIVLTWVWSIRLTHNYFRRERWEWGKREDWRFAEMRTKYGTHWWWISIFVVFVSQQVFLIGICLPMYAIHSSRKQWGHMDVVATVACISGIVIAYFADSQLHYFVSNNERLKTLGAPLVPNLETGLWRYSRHPNYFGEQLWWWGLFLFAWHLGQGWMLVGPLANSLCLVYVTVLVERRMLKQDYRAETYRQYQRTTSVWIPWFKRYQKEKKQKDI